MKKWGFLIAFITLSLSHVFSQCTPSFTYQSDTSNFVVFTNLTPQNIAFSYRWNFGDGSPIDTSYSPSHQYSSSGSYVVTLSIDSASIICGTIVDTIYVNYCNAYFTTQITNNVVQFQNYSAASSASSYNWDFGDGNFSQQKNPTHTYQLSGQYAVNLDVYDSLSSCFTSFSDSITVNVPPCRAGFSYSSNQDTLFIQNQANNYQIVSYDFGDSTNTTNENPIHIYSQSGTYLVCQTVTDTLNNCTDIYCDTVNINIPPTCRAGYSYSTNQDTLFIQNQASNYQLISYDFGDSTISNTENPIHLFDRSGTYLVCQTVTDTNNNCTDTFCDSVNIFIPQPCQAGFTYTVNEDSLFIQNAASNYQTLTYDFGDGDTTTSENPVHIYAQSGTYRICQTVENTGNNCIDVFCDTISIAIPPPCQAGFTYQFQGDSTIFQNTAVNYDSLIYFFGDGNSSTLENPIHQYMNSGEYIVGQRVFNHRNCVSTFIDTIQVTISTSCVAKFELALDTTNPSTLYLVNTSSNDNSNQYFWDFGDGNTSSQKNPIHQYAENKPYPICLTVFDTIMDCMSIYCDTVGLDSNGNILKSSGFTLKVIDGSAIGIKENKNELKTLVVYPNPADEFIKLIWPSDVQKMDYQLIGSQGQLIESGRIHKTQGDHPIKLHSIEAGVYWLIFTSDENRVIRKIIKQ